jgi:hypothetical protein
MLQAGKSRVRFPLMSLDFSVDLMLPSALWTWDQPSLLREMSTRNIPGGKWRPARKADNHAAIYEPIIWKMWEPRHLTTLWASTACYRDSLFFLRSWPNVGTAEGTEENIESPYSGYPVPRARFEQSTIQIRV